MIITVKNEKEDILAYISFVVVDEENRLDPRGKYLYVNGLWVHPKHRNKTRSYLRQFIEDMFVHPETQRVKQVYWQSERTGKIKKYLAYRFIRPIYTGDKNGRKNNYSPEYQSNLNA